MKSLLVIVALLTAFPAYAEEHAAQKAYCKDRNCVVLANGNILAKCHFGEMVYRWEDRFNGRFVRYTCKP